MPPPSALSRTVASLTRAAMGADAPPADVGDDELDKYIAEMILREAREKNAAAARPGGSGSSGSSGRSRA